MIRALVLLVLLLPSPAWALRAILIGNSIPGGLVNIPGLGADNYGISRFQTAAAMTALAKKLPGGDAWKDATFESYAVSGSKTQDWTVKAAKTSECVGSHNPWPVCDGAATCLACMCDLFTSSYTPQGKTACAARTKILDYVPSDADAILIQADGFVFTNASDAVDDIEDLIAAAALKAPTVLVGSPSHSDCVSLEAQHAAVRAEMVSRGLITGPDFFGAGKAAVPCSRDGVHTTDTGEVAFAYEWMKVLP